MSSKVLSADRVTPSRSQIPPLTEEDAHFKKINVLERTKIRSWVLTEPEIKIYYAGEGQQHFM
jgi:hypothetical protein